MLVLKDVLDLVQNLVLIWKGLNKTTYIVNRARIDLFWENCGQSYNGSTIVNYGSRVVIWGIFRPEMNAES